MLFKITKSLNFLVKFGQYSYGLNIVNRGPLSDSESVS